ncbi:MAG: SPOR domain-containing protein [Bacteroidia bacterium]|nr:SPOR domain-containing protein [Bacteroidia bacterium]
MNWILLPCLTLCIIIGNVFFSFSQERDSTRKGSVIINESSEIKTLVETYINESSSKKTCEGFRVQVLSESGNDAKKKANDAKTTFLSQFSKYPAYLIFQTPNFKIRVGDFRTKLEAYHCLKEIQSVFPNAFVVKDEIQFPAIEN